MVVIFLGAMSDCHVSQPAVIFTPIVTVLEEDDDETIEICLPKIDILYLSSVQKRTCGTSC
jgi:hypothetical protein